MLLITIFLAVLAIVMMVLGILGGAMSFTKPLSKNLLIWGSIGFGIIMLVLIIIQAVINDRDIRDHDNKFDEMRLSLNGQLENLKGQLSAFSQLAAQALHPSAVIPQQLSKEISKSVRDLSNDELRNKVMQLVNNMRDFETNFRKEEQQRDFNQPPLKGTPEEINKQFQQKINASIQRRLEFDNEFRKRFLGEAISYRDELLKRLSIMPPEEEHRIIALQGFLAGAQPISDLAMYLEKLDRQLP